MRVGGSGWNWVGARFSETHFKIYLPYLSFVIKPFFYIAKQSQGKIINILRMKIAFKMK